MTREKMISVTDFVHSSFGPDADLDIGDDGSAFITTPHAALVGFFAFDHESVARLTLVPVTPSQSFFQPPRTSRT